MPEFTTFTDFKATNPEMTYGDYIEFLTDEIVCYMNPVIPDPKTRTLQDLVAFVQAMQSVTARFMDEISDGAYNE